MGRMIDADKAIFELGASDRDIYCRYHIEEQPTAYDVEVVVKQMKEKAFPDFEEEYSCNGEQLVWLSDVLEIVRNGGVK